MMASLLRNLVHSQMFIPIRQELNFCRMYLDMFMLRYTDRFEYFMEIDPAIGDFGVPKGFMQPVLENYFIHGIREGAFDNWLKITGRMVDGWIIFDIEDNGKGIDTMRLNEIRSEFQELDVNRKTYGLANVNDRIRLVYGLGSGIQIDSDAASNKTVVHVSIRALSCEEMAKSISIVNK
jgi:two-component system sensor histidine kinase YesM